jgi:glycerol-3-phosphate acyltransferase PlsX
VSGRRPRVVLDAGSGEQGAHAAVTAAAATDPAAVALLLSGPEGVLESMRAKSDAPFLVLPAPASIGMGHDPVDGVLRGKDSSLVVAMRAVVDGIADAVVTPANTGAAVVAASGLIRRLPSVRNPALATTIPRSAGATVLVDAGATSRCTPDQLCELALLGGLYASARFGIKHPRIGLLANGTEVGKGDDTLREARMRLSTEPSFVGFVESYSLVSGDVDVVVTEGLLGNIVLKTIEAATHDTVAAIASGEDRQHGDLYAVLAEQRATDFGAVLLGVRAPVVIAHGAARSGALASAIGLAGRLVEADIVGQISRAAHRRARFLASVDPPLGGSQGRVP